MNDPEGFSKWWTDPCTKLTKGPVLSDCRAAYKAGQQSQAQRVIKLESQLSRAKAESSRLRAAVIAAHGTEVKDNPTTVQGVAVAELILMARDGGGQP